MNFNIYVITIILKKVNLKIYFSFINSIFRNPFFTQNFIDHQNLDSFLLFLYLYLYNYQALYYLMNYLLKNFQFYIINYQLKFF